MKKWVLYFSNRSEVLDSQFKGILDPVREQSEPEAENGRISLEEGLKWRVHRSEKNIEQSFNKKQIPAGDDHAFQSFCSVRHQCISNCQAEVIHKRKLILRNGECHVFGRPSLGSERMLQSVAVLFSSATLLTVS